MLPMRYRARKKKNIPVSLPSSTTPRLPFTPVPSEPPLLSVDHIPLLCSLLSVSLGLLLLPSTAGEAVSVWTKGKIVQFVSGAGETASVPTDLPVGRRRGRLWSRVGGRGRRGRRGGRGRSSFRSHSQGGRWGADREAKLGQPVRAQSRPAQADPDVVLFVRTASDGADYAVACVYLKKNK